MMTMMMIMEIMMHITTIKNSGQPPQISVCPTQSITMAYIIDMDKLIYTARKYPAAPTAPQQGHF
jgi:hypothetical protein